MELCEITADFANLRWQQPKDNGGSDISGYTIEKRENETSNWTMVSNSVSRTNCRIPSLITGLEYTFRVMAENRAGLSPPASTQPALAKHPFNVPSAPENVQIVEIHKESVTVSYEPPRKNGGARVTAYVVEYKERNSQYWKIGGDAR